MCRTSRFHVVFGTIAVFAAVGLACAQRPLDGGAKVQPIAVYASAEPLPKPDRAVIYPFVLPPDVITPDRPAAPVEEQVAVASEDVDVSPMENLAGAAQAGFSKALVDELQKAHVFAESAVSGDVAPPGSLVVRGSFAPVVPRKSKRPLMGLGRGATGVQLDVAVSLLTKAKPVLVSEFYFQLGNGKKAGRLQTSTVAKGTEPNTEETSDAVQADASRIAKALAAQIERIMAAQQWLAPPQTASK